MGMEMEVMLPRCKSIVWEISSVAETSQAVPRNTVVPSDQALGGTRTHVHPMREHNNYNIDNNSSRSNVDYESRLKPISSTGMPMGLRIVIHRCQKESNNIVNKFMFKSQTSPSSSPPPSTSFLRDCHLCKKQLSPNKDVYMYRGDQGFCSVECRSRQITMDELEERDDFYLRREMMGTRRRRTTSTLQSQPPQVLCRSRKGDHHRVREYSSRPAKGIVPAMA